MKRWPDLVPFGYDRELKRLSKADLAEIAWDFGARLVGDDSAHTSIFREILHTNKILQYHRNRAKKERNAP